MPSLTIGTFSASDGDRASATPLKLVQVPETNFRNKPKLESTDA
jgi:hypothetical protein